MRPFSQGPLSLALPHIFLFGCEQATPGHNGFESGKHGDTFRSPEMFHRSRASQDRVLAHHLTHSSPGQQDVIDEAGSAKFGCHGGQCALRNVIDWFQRVGIDDGEIVEFRRRLGGKDGESHST